MMSAARDGVDEKERAAAAVGVEVDDAVDEATHGSNKEFLLLLPVEEVRFEAVVAARRERACGSRGAMAVVMICFSPPLILTMARGSAAIQLAPVSLLSSICRFPSLIESSCRQEVVICSRVGSQLILTPGPSK